MRRLALLALALLAGCGGDDPEMADGGGRLVAALGDSITAGSPLWDPDPAVRARIGGAADERSQYEHWAERRLPGVRFRNCGVLGERTDQIAARLEDCARGAGTLVVQGGINDIAQFRRVKAAARNLRAMVERGRELGLEVALAELLPWNNGYPGADLRVRRLNRLIAVIGRDEGVPVYPWYETLADPRRPGRMRPEWTIDGNHPSIEGYRLLGETVELPG
jgi:lysophospholipase L1-like esterase